MHPHKRIAIILPDTLRCLGLQSLLGDYFSPVEIACFPTFEALSAAGNEGYDYYFTDAALFLLNMDFFLPRRGATMVLVDSSGNEGGGVAPHPLFTGASPEEMLEWLERLFNGSAAHRGDPSKGLSVREMDVLQRIVKGSTNKDVADQLNISLNTVLTHRKNITAKLGIKTLSGLTFYAIMNGLIAGEDIDN